MNYLREDVTEEEFRSGLLDAGVTLSVIFPLLATFLVRRGEHIQFQYIYLMVGCFSVAMIYVGFKLHQVVRTGSVILPPKVTFVLTASIGLSIGFINTADGGPFSLFRVAWLVPALFMSIIGNLSMQSWTWVVYMSSFGWSTWENGERGGLLLVSVLIMGAVLGVMPFVVRVPVLGLIAVQRSRRGLDNLTDIALDSQSIETGLEQCLPLIGNVMPVSHVVALIRPRGSTNFEIASAFPSRSDADRFHSQTAEFLEALTSGKCVFGNNHVIIPVGETFKGNLILVLTLAGKITSDQHFTLTNEMGEALAGSFLRLANRVASVTALKDLSLTDALTGLANRRMLEERSESELANALASDTDLSVAMIDIDLFKQYNDTFGHLAGDVLLRRLADSMVQRLRKQDLIARYGGEEFCIILPNTDLDNAYQVIDALRETVQLVSANSPMSVSGGVAQWDRAESFESLVQRADWALYDAKTSGRNKILCNQQAA